MGHVIVIGGGILGLAVARELTARRGHSVTVLEKEATWASHQTGRNSGVIHAGLYYKPGTLKARMCVAGNRSMIEYAKDRGIPFDVCGKLVVAVDDAERPRLEVLAERARANGVPARMLSPEQAREYEPEVAAVAALRVESTAIISYRAVGESLAADLAASGVTLYTGQRVTGIISGAGVGRVAVGRAGVGQAAAGRAEIVVQSSSLEVRGDALVNCAGLHSDKIAKLAGLDPGAKIVPFRGEYYELRPARTSLVKGLIYPVPDPAFPFLGVHLTRMIDGSVHAGPNAVLALRREGYRWRDASARDMAETLTYPGFWRLARRHYRAGLSEMTRSFSAARFAASVARLVPAVTKADIIRAGAGVRAQVLTRSGALADDFLIQTAPHQVHVLNAPSPAATGAFEIARHVADQLTATIS